ncbi:hypothetical protein H920_10142 [Fukomys damarensis]|uniref:Uncharacterized protein n=1 Tax=Fukomys damarensis TaxID=885580 RepID=A0A091DZQ1_FUKDA|nr:hypothetical protein H920_10142 [Fukomys damarensis]
MATAALNNSRGIKQGIRPQAHLDFLTAWQPGPASEFLETQKAFADPGSPVYYLYLMGFS